jgi:sugar lactone lactonase YvrE
MRKRAMPGSTHTSIHPLRAIEGGRVSIAGHDFPADPPPTVRVDDREARVVFASRSRLTFLVPPDLEGGDATVRVGEDQTGTLAVGTVWATGLHQVDNPVFNAHGDLFVTYSGSRGQQAPVSIFRVSQAGTREPFSSGIVNATSMTFGPDGLLYVSSRFEGLVYRVAADGTCEPAASDLGVACGLAFDADGILYVGDRSGTVFRVEDGRATPFATLPASVAAFHLAMSPDGELFVSGPTLGSYDYVYRITREGVVRTVPTPFGRPQGLAFSPDGVLHVVDALAGASGVYRLPDLEGPPELTATGHAMVGLAFGPSGQFVVASNDTAYGFPS